MSEFVGRTGSQRVYSYPEAPRGGYAAQFARNFASGPATTTTIDIDPGTQLPWDVIDSGAPPGVNVPITPRSSGIILVTGVISLKSSSEIDEVVQLLIEVNGVPLPVPFLESNTISASGFEAIPFVAEITGLAVGVAANVQVRLISSNATDIGATLDSSTINLQEVPAATG